MCAATSIVGVGQTAMHWESGRSTTSLALEALRGAAADAGIEPHQIDGIVPYPMGPTVEDVAPLLGASDLRYTAGSNMGGASALASLQHAVMAVESGRADYVAVFVSRNGRSGSRIDRRVRALPGQVIRRRLEYVHGMNIPAQWYALMCRRHMYEFGTTREALGAVAVLMRQNAQRNPGAQTFGKPLSLEQYLAGEVIADPYLRYDCCLETDAASAVIITTTERARDARRTTVRIAAVSEGHPRPADDIASRDDIFETGLTHAAPRAYAAAGLASDDVDVAMIYDCFTFELIQQLEEAGFCRRGEGGAFITDGHIDPGGSLPVNPHGGLIGEGHVAGMNHVVEAVRQLRGECGSRQVAGARVAAVTGWGDLGDGAMALLTAD